MDARTGKRLDGDAHLAQSLSDILATAIGTRVQLRDYGSALFELLDQPMNGLTRLRLFAATAIAIARWEPRVILNRVGLDLAEPSQPALTLEASRRDDPSNGLVRLALPLRPQTA